MAFARVAQVNRLAALISTRESRLDWVQKSHCISIASGVSPFFTISQNGGTIMEEVESLPLKGAKEGILAKATKFFVAIAAILGAIYVAGTKVIAIQKLAPDFYYGTAEDSCSDSSGYGAALRSANIGMIRCYIEKEGRSAARTLPNDDLHAGHYPLALTAEACSLKASKYLVLLRGADPRYGHIYMDPNRPPGLSNDTPIAIAQSHCSTLPEGRALVSFLQERVNRISPTGR